MTLPTPAAAAAFLLKHWLPVALFALLAIQTVRIEGFGIWPIRIVGLQEKYETAIDKLVNARAELKRISTAKNEQGGRTIVTIREAEKGNREADERAKRVEQAPPTQNCETSPEVMRADI